MEDTRSVEEEALIFGKPDLANELEYFKRRLAAMEEAIAKLKKRGVTLQEDLKNITKVSMEEDSKHNMLMLAVEVAVETNTSIKAFLNDLPPEERAVFVKGDKIMKALASDVPVLKEILGLNDETRRGRQ